MDFSDWWLEKEPPAASACGIIKDQIFPLTTHSLKGGFLICFFGLEDFDVTLDNILTFL